MTAAKWGLFVIAVIASRPAGRWLRDRPTMRIWVWTAVGFFPFYSPALMSLIFFPGWPGDVAGIEVALIDWLALTLLQAQRGPFRPLPYRLAMAGYLVVSLVAVSQAEWTLAALGYVWRLGRMYLLYAAICRAEDDKRVPAALLRGMAVGVLYECLWAAWQHFGLGIHQATGQFAHQNTLAILVNLVVMVPIALILAGRTATVMKLVPLAALAISVFTVSRGALLFLGLGGAIVYFLSLLRGFSLRKAKFGLAGLAAVPVVVVIGLNSLKSRSPEQLASSMETRVQYESAAAMMLRDHPLGIGPNHFTITLLTRGYGNRAGVGWRSQRAIVHNIYLVTAAEMGYLGLLALIVLFLTPLVPAIRHSLQARGDRRGDLLLGLGVSLAIFYVHSLFEWLWRATEVSYVYWMVVAMSANLCREIRDAARTPPHDSDGRMSPRPDGVRLRGAAWVLQTGRALDRAGAIIP